MMKALLLTGYGGIDKYKLATIPIPEPSANEALIRISAIALNNTDINTRIGAYGDVSDEGDSQQKTWDGSSLKFPWIQGCDACGYIVRLGSNYAPKSKEYIGRRVVINPITNKLNKDNQEILDTFIGSEVPGVYAGYIAVSMDNLYIIDDDKVSLKDYELCTFLCAYITAQGMITNAEIKSNENVLVSGASGGVGSALIQLLLINNANPIIIVGNKQKATDLMMRIDENANVIMLNRDNWYNQLVEEHADIEIDAVLDVVSGTQNYNNYLKILRVGGRVVTAGAIAGSEVNINIRNVYLKYLKIIGSTCGTKDDFVKVMQYVESGRLKPMVYRKYDGIGSIPAAQLEFMQKKHTGKIVVDYNIKSKL